MTNIRLGGYTVDDATEIKRRVLGLANSQKMLDGKKQLTVQNQQYYVKLLEPLDAATNPETGYTQANARILRYVQPVDPNSLDMEEAGTGGHEIIKITNRSIAFSAGVGETIRVDKMGSEWSPSHGSGGANNSGDNCPCSCILTGDLIVNGIETTRLMCVELPLLNFQQSFGSILLAANSYCLVWNSTSQTWTLDVGDYLTAVYADGTDATSVTTMDGTATLTFPTTGKPTLSVCVTGTVPEKQLRKGLEVGFEYGYINGFIDGYAGNPYDDRVIFAGATGTGAGTGQYQQFGTGTYLAPGTGTYGENTGTGTGTGTFMWSDYEEGFYNGYKEGYPLGYSDGQNAFNTGTGTTPGTGTYIPPGTSVPPEEL